MISTAVAASVEAASSNPSTDNSSASSEAKVTSHPTASVRSPTSVYGRPVTFTLTVSKAGTAAPILTGTVEFPTKVP